MIVLVAIGVAAASLGILFFSSWSETNATIMKTSDTKAKNNDDSSAEIMRLLLSPTTENVPALGTSEAKVTVVEFGDYQCTWCHRWHSTTKDSLLENYADTGKIRFMFKDFPINDLSDRASSMAAEASYCAADQGKYWQYHDELYNSWEGENTGWVTKASLRQFAEKVGLDNKAFTECLDSGRHGDLVRQNYNLAVAIGLNSTPSFIILSDGETPTLIRGAHPLSTFQQVIDDAYTP
jgi:protein-disulfide isomerase